MIDDQEWPRTFVFGWRIVMLALIVSLVVIAFRSHWDLTTGQSRMLAKIDRVEHDALIIRTDSVSLQAYLLQNAEISNALRQLRSDVDDIKRIVYAKGRVR